LVSEKFFSILAILFGIGMAITFERTLERKGRFGSLYIRRLIGLFIIGISHALLFYAGDYIGNYALLGFILMFFCNRKPATILIMSMIILLIPIFMIAPRIFQQPPANQQVQTEQAQKQEKMLQQRINKYNQRSVQIYGHGSISEIFKLRYRETISQYRSLMFVGWKLLSMLFLGLWCWKKGIVKSLQENLNFIRKIMWISLIIGVTGNAVSLYGEVASSGLGPYFELVAFMGQEFGAPALGIFYITGIVLLYYGGIGVKILNLFGPVGRMAMSNYVFQSIICTTLFYSYGFGLYYKTSYAMNVLLALVLFIIQIIVSHLWFKKFNYGPLEWLLRTFMYGRWGVAP